MLEHLRIHCHFKEMKLNPLGPPTTFCCILSASWRVSVLNIYWKDWCWSWSSNTLATWFKIPTHGKRPDAGKDWRQEKKGVTEDETVGWHHWLSGHEFEQNLEDDEEQGSLRAAVHWVSKSQTRLKDWTIATNNQKAACPVWSPNQGGWWIRF